MSEQLSWPIEKIEASPHYDGEWRVWQKGLSGYRLLTTEELVAAGIPAEPYPPTPVVITVTRGDQSSSFELPDHVAADWASGFSPPGVGWGDPTERLRMVAAALRELGVGRD